MDLTVHIPDELVAHLGGQAVQAELERRALEAFALEEYKASRITKVQLRKMLASNASNWMASSNRAACMTNTPWKISSASARLSKSWDFRSVQLVIADTSPINYLIQIGYIDLLPRLI